MENEINPFAPKKRHTDPRIERQIPMTKQAANPLTRVPQLNVEDSTTCNQIVIGVITKNSHGSLTEILIEIRT